MVDAERRHFKASPKLILSALIVICIVVWWSHADTTKTWRYRMTVEVETPEGLKIGTAVKEVHLRHETSLLPDQGGSMRSTGYGEAVVVDLGKRGLLFVLNNRPGYMDSYEADIFFDTFRGKEKSGKAQLNPEDWPALVTFRNPEDMNTLQVFSPPENLSRIDAKAALDREFSETFGSGVHLNSIVIEVTTDPVTRGEVFKFGLSQKSIDDYFEHNRKKLKYGDPRMLSPQSFW